MATDLAPRFGARLRSSRLAAGLSQEALAERAGLSVRAISDLERGARRLPHPHTVRQLARALRLSAADRAQLEAAIPRRATAEPAPLVPAPPPPTNLPAPLTSFVGREHELAELARLLPTTRLLTLTGTGGVGKTRLALALVAGLLADYADGVWLVELAPLADPDLVPHGVATALDVRVQPGQPLLATLVATLAAKRLLLLVDNCEHLLDASARLADAVIRGCPGVRVLATSREALGIAGEVVWRVPSLTLPTVTIPPALATVLQAEAAQLFVARAGAARPEFPLTDHDAGAVAQICQHLDGIPLAIELAAARARVLPIDQIAGRLDDRFRLLTGGGRTAQPRQQTLRAAVDWSYDLLTEAERTVLRRLSVFAGGWTLEAAEAVCAGDGIEAGTVLDGLTRLVDTSLVVAEPERGEGRYRLLETIRQYAGDRLAEAGEAATLRDRHGAWCLALLVEAEPHLRGSDQIRWRDRLAFETDNVRAALAWRLAGDVAVGLALANRVARLWQGDARMAELQRWLVAALARAPEPTLARAEALIHLTSLIDDGTDTDRAMAWLEESIAISRRLAAPHLLAPALHELGLTCLETDDLQRARRLCEEALALRRAEADPRGEAAIRTSLGWAAVYQGDLPRARALLEPSLAVLRGLGDLWHESRALWGLTWQALFAGDYERAEELNAAKQGLVDQLGMDAVRAAVSGVQRGQIAWARGDVSRAAACFAAGQALAGAHQTPQSGVWATIWAARVLLEQGEVGPARALLGDGLTRAQAHGWRRYEAMARHGLGLAAWRQGEAGEAHRQFRQSLELRRAMGVWLGQVESLEGMGVAAATGGRAAAGARLLAAAGAARERLGAPLPPYERPAVATATAVARSALQEAAYATVWASGCELPLERAVAEALIVGPA